MPISVVPAWETTLITNPVSGVDFTQNGQATFTNNNTFSGGLMTTTIGQLFVFTGNTSAPSQAFRVNSNIRGLWGTTGQSGIYYDGTNMVIDPKIGGSGVVHLNSGNIILNKIGLGDSAISANFYINFVGSGGNRGAMNFDFTATGTNPVVDALFKATVQNTNAAPSAQSIQTQMIKNCDQTGTGLFASQSVKFGTANTQTITQGTSAMVGLDISADQGSGTANTGGTVRDFGIRINAFPGYTGVGTYTKWGINSAEDVQLNTGVMLILEGSPTAKGDSGFLFDTTTANKIQCLIDNVVALDWRQATMNFADPYDIVIGTTTGTKIGTGTTQKIGFWNKTPAVQQTSAALTNNVTSGGTNDTIANYTDLVIYANDAAAIRNDIYQLARKVKEIGDALRTYGILG